MSFNKLTILLIILLISCSSNNSTSVKDTGYAEFIAYTYTQLDAVLNQRKNDLIMHLNESWNAAEAIRNDKTLINFFAIKNEYYKLKKEGDIPPEIALNIENLKKNIHSYYLLKYINFYDLLFINEEGDIFYTIRKQADYHKNIFDKSLRHTMLSKKLINSKNESFVDFEFYQISGEPSAFFIEPVKQERKQIGWIVLQCSINKINSMFTKCSELKTTGEVVLVNKAHYLLTNSRFKVEPTILKQQLPFRNIEYKFNEGKGRKAVTDYRGKHVYSCFETFSFLGSDWLIIAKIDKNEVVTEYYKKNKKNLLPQLTPMLHSSLYSDTHKITKDTNYTRVDMDEYQRTTDNIHTMGVATCTGVSISYPERFTYLAHISPYDRIYNESRTNLVCQMIKHLSYFEITPSENEHIQINAISTQTKSLEKLIDLIIDNNFFLNQIKFIYNNNAEYGNLYSNTNTGSCTVNWQTADSAYNQSFSSIPDLETLILSIAEK